LTVVPGACRSMERSYRCDHLSGIDTFRGI